MAVAFGWKGAVDTDLQFSEFYAGDHTVAIWFLPQYPNGYAGPILSVNGTGNYLVGQGDRNTQTGAHLISRIEGASGVHIPSAFPTGQWSHLVVVRSGNQIKVFLNGQSLGSTLTLTGVTSPVGTLRLGRPAPGMGVDNQEAQFYGMLDELAVYTRARSDAEVLTQFTKKAHLSGKTTGLLAGWRFTATPPSSSPRFLRPAVRSGEAAMVATSGTWSGADIGLIPLPTHDSMELPFLSGEPWTIPQGFAAEFSHRGYAAFCWDFQKADVGTGWADIYPNGSFRAPVYATGSDQVSLVSDASPPLSPSDSETENMVQATGSDGFVRAHLHLLKGTVRVAVGQPTKSGQPIGQISTEWRCSPPVPHLHFAVNPPTDAMVGWVTVPSAFDNYEVRQPSGAWVFVSRGIPQQGAVVRRTGPMSSWDEIGHANRVTAMTAMNNKLFVATNDFKLWWRDPVGRDPSGADVNWDFIGLAPPNVVAMAATDCKLFAATADNNLWWRDPLGKDIAWDHIGHANDVVAMTATNGKLFAATKDNKLWWREPVGTNVGWGHIGQADGLVAMGATHGKLFAATRDNRLLWRDPVGTNVGWDHIGHANNVVGMAGMNGRLFAATKANKLWWRID